VKFEVFHSVVISLVARFEEFKPGNQRNIQEDQYPESRD
jgi:hypothetical protein